MFKVEANKRGKVLFYFIGILCVALFVAMLLLYPDMAAYFSDTSMKILAPAVYIVLMALMPVLAYSGFDSAVLYLIAENNEFRIKHLFRKEIIVTPDRITKWKCYTQFLRNGTTSENIIIYYDKRGRIEFGIHECTNFEKLLKHLGKKFADKEV